MKIIRVAVLAALAATVAGCASGPSREQLAASDARSCTGYGHRTGTEAYAKCRENRDTLRTIQDERRAIALSNAVNSIDFKPIVPVQTQRHCVSKPVLGAIDTVCD